MLRLDQKTRLIALLVVLLIAACSASPRDTVKVASGRAAPPPSARSSTAPAPLAGPSGQADNAALQWAIARIGAPYQWGGTGADGFDCSGLVQVAYSRMGVRLPRTARDQARRGQMVERSNLRPGDLVFFGDSASSINHVGIAAGGDRFVHASTSRGVVEDSLDEDYFRRRYVYARRVTTSAASR